MADGYDFVDIRDSPVDRAGRSPKGRKLVLYMALMMGSTVIGISVTVLPPLLVVGGLVGLACVAGILSKPYLGLLFYTVAFLLRPAELYPVLAPLRLERVIGFVTLAALFLEQYRQERRLSLDGTRQTGLLLLFFVGVLCTVPFSLWRAKALEGFVDMFKVVAFYIMVVQLVNTRSRLRKFTWVYSILIGYLSVSALKGYFSGNAKFAQGIERVVGTTSAGGDPNHLATTMAVSFPLFLLLMLNKSVGWRRIPLALGCIALLVTIVIAGSRASLLGFLASIVCLWWFSRRRMLVGILALALLAVFFSVIPDQYKTRYSTITESKLDASSQSRLTAWKAGMRMTFDRPLCGVGISCFGAAHGMKYSPEFQRSYLQSHSLYVQVFAELGIPVAIVFFALLAQMIKTNRQAAGRLLRSGQDWGFERSILNAMFVGFVVLMVSGFFGHSLLRRTWYVYAATGLAILRIYLATIPPANQDGATRGSAED